MYFLNPQYFWLLLFIPAFLILFVIRIKKLPSIKLLGNLPSMLSRCFGIFLFACSFVSLIVALSSPYYNNIRYPYKNLRIFFLLDVSKSMAYAEDIKPNRLVAAKKEIEQAYMKLDNIESGLILFSGAANIDYCPKTNKKDTFLTLLKHADIDAIDIPGTDISAAFEGLKRIVEKYKITSGTNLAIILSDGGKEENQGINADDLRDYISNLRKIGFTFYTVGIGGTKPADLVKRIDGKLYGNYKDENNKVLQSELDEVVLRSIANQGGGRYFRFSKEGELSGYIDDVITGHLELDYDKSYNEMVDISHYFYGLSCVCMVLLVLMNKHR